MSAPLPRRPLARQLQDQPGARTIGQPEYAPWEANPLDSPDPSPALQASAQRGWEKFRRRAGDDDQGEEPQR